MKLCNALYFLIVIINCGCDNLKGLVKGEKTDQERISEFAKEKKFENLNTIISSSKSKVLKITSFIKIGEINGDAVVRDFDTEELFIYRNGGFNKFKKKFVGYYPVFANSNVIIYLDQDKGSTLNLTDRPSKIALLYKRDSVFLDLPEKPNLLVANTTGDTLFYSIGIDNEYDELRIVNTKSKIIEKGVRCYYEGFSMTKRGLVCLVQASEHKNKIILTKNGKEAIKNLSPEGTYDFLYDVDPEGKYAIVNQPSEKGFNGYLINLFNKRYNKLMELSEPGTTTFFSNNSICFFRNDNPILIKKIRNIEN